MTARPLNILLVASEAAPFAKTGGLGDVTGSLPAALTALGHRVVLVLPWYRCVRQAGIRPRASRTPVLVPFAGRMTAVRFRSAVQHGVRLLFLDVPDYYDRPQLYGEGGTDYPDNDLRFGLLSRAAFELVRRIDFRPDVIHAHDWQTGLTPLYLREQLWADPFFADSRSLFTIHNLGYHGLFPFASLHPLGLDSSLAGPDGLEFFGRISLLKAGIRYADRVNTVSPSYCDEIRTPAQGMGLDGLLRWRGEQLHGILNGIDTDLWNPANDPALAAPYAADRPAGKKDCKLALQRELNLPECPRTPLLALITRLDPQKGIDLLLDAFDRLLEHDVQLVLLGTGSPDYERRLTECARFYPDKVRVLLRFDDRLSRRIYAASDLFLMPSRYEPCGLGQLIALRYGSLPVVHATGGLRDTICDPQHDPARANGFTFEIFSRAELLAAVERALDFYRQQAHWQQLRRQAMQQNFSWSRAAGDYVDLYRRCREVPIYEKSKE
ncbi:MAG: glycogen synthase GlgA [Desulfuromonadales bacterium]|nr:glycogen synthase GlgA [Desulfuromonadales bacterium]